jgi:DNA-binding MarR family transcriptional regulator
MVTPGPETIALWTRLMTSSRVLLERVEGALKAAGLPPLSWYDALLELEKAEEGGLRPFALQERLLLPQYGTSRLVDRLVGVGLVERRPCAEDGRGQELAITAEGRAMRARMWPVYAGELVATVEAALPAEEAKRAAEALDALIRAAR